MTIQLNTDNNLSVHEEYSAKIEELLTKELHRFSDHITRLEVHLSDENGNKDSLNDKKCVLEARMEGRQPVAVSANGDNYDLALNNSIHKLKASLETIIGKIKSHRRD